MHPVQYHEIHNIKDPYYKHKHNRNINLPCKPGLSTYFRIIDTYISNEYSTHQKNK